MRFKKKRSSNLESIPLIKYGTVICRYRDAGYLQATIDVSDFKSYKIFLSFDSDTDGFINNEPYPFNVNNTVYIRSGKVNFVSGSSLSIAFLIVGIKKWLFSPFTSPVIHLCHKCHLGYGKMVLVKSMRDIQIKLRMFDITINIEINASRWRI